jgi:hypothetical protein
MAWFSKNNFFKHRATLIEIPKTEFETKQRPFWINPSTLTLTRLEGERGAHLKVDPIVKFYGHWQTGKGHTTLSNFLFSFQLYSQFHECEKGSSGNRMPNNLTLLILLRGIQLMFVQCNCCSSLHNCTVGWVDLQWNLF